MTVCTFCEEPGAGYLQIYQGREKVTSVPVCSKHSLFAAAYQELGQDWLRTQFAKALGIRKGSVPRVKFSLKP